MTANQAYKGYKDGGGTLSFKNWIDREKKKKFMNADGVQVVPVNEQLNSSITDVLNEAYQTAGEQDSLNNKYIFGINRNLLIGIGVVGLAIGGYFIYKHYKK